MTESGKCRPVFTRIYFFKRTLKTIGAQCYPFLSRRSDGLVALLFLGLSSVAAPLTLTTTQHSGAKNQYILPLDLGDDWRTNLTIINREQEQANLTLFAYGRDGRFLAVIPTLTS